MSIRLFFLSFLLFGCKEFYDEEFEEFEERHSGTVSEKAVFNADLNSTDSSVTSLSGSAVVDVSGEEANVEVRLQGIPANINQITYGIISTPCSSLSLSIPQSNLEDRTIEVTEDLSRSALIEDLRSSGSAEDTLSLSGKSFIVRGTPQFSGLPNPAGTNQLILACGELVDSSENRNDAQEVFKPRNEDDELPGFPTANGL